MKRVFDKTKHLSLLDDVVEFHIFGYHTLACVPNSNQR